MNKKLLYGALSSIFAVGMLAACGDAEEPAEDGVDVDDTEEEVDTDADADVDGDDELEIDELLTTKKQILTLTKKKK
ncbi:hypothetical protein [Geomicrobium sp. JCM 19055]|uniref:hypothetical protein n=1 Tax=Geomicrobium sp. JCM 19055 TaxID=1460649 RepID=UPI00045ECE2F|nr:hypothetical protein [Geomicrobium sp. JCM 19055]GAJ97342.1 hypothetical protein JCM19055_193 [Geomicrobium sp. JCM 19055]